jgi:hypothetical protein
MFLIGGAAAVLIRLELITADASLVSVRMRSDETPLGEGMSLRCEVIRFWSFSAHE